MPAGIVEDKDWPFGVLERCGWLDEVLLCEQAGVVHRALRRHDEAIEGGERTWMRTAGLEWRSGYTLTDGEVLTWSSHEPPYVGWQIVHDPLHAHDVSDPVVTDPRPLEIRGADWPPDALASATGALAGCSLHPSLPPIPVEVLYDKTSEARLVRFQGFVDGLTADDMACVARALGEPRSSADSLELQLVAP